MAEQVPTPELVEIAQDAADPELTPPQGAELSAAVEALLFSASDPLSVKRLSVLLNGVPEVEVAETLVGLLNRYGAEDSGLTLLEVAGGWQLATKSETTDWVMRLHRHRKKAALSPALLESLAIIAYKQPITRAEVEAIRGVDCGSILRSLQDASLVEIVGRKEVAGKPPLYGTSEAFLKAFGLKDLDALPSLADFRKLAEDKG